MSGLIDSIRKDRETGTPGPWVYESRQPISDHVIVAADGAEVADCWNSTDTGEVSDGSANARRVARVPDMEAALLAADALADALDRYNRGGAGPLTGWLDVEEALAAYREAAA